MTLKDIKETLHKLDLLKRPWIVFAHPSDVKAIKEAFPRIEEEVVIKETENVEQGKAVAVEREEFEKWANNSFGYTWSELE